MEQTILGASGRSRQPRPVGGQHTQPDRRGGVTAASRPRRQQPAHCHRGSANNGSRARVEGSNPTTHPAAPRQRGLHSTELATNPMALRRWQLRPTHKKPPRRTQRTLAATPKPTKQQADNQHSGKTTATLTTRPGGEHSRRQPSSSTSHYGGGTPHQPQEASSPHATYHSSNAEAHQTASWQPPQWQGNSGDPQYTTEWGAQQDQPGSSNRGRTDLSTLTHSGMGARFA